MLQNIIPNNTPDSSMIQYMQQTAGRKQKGRL
jgi:hypothetical protein